MGSGADSALPPVGSDGVGEASVRSSQDETKAIQALARNIPDVDGVQDQVVGVLVKALSDIRQIEAKLRAEGVPSENMKTFREFFSDPIHRAVLASSELTRAQERVPDVAGAAI